MVFDNEEIQRLSRLEVQRWFKHLATLPHEEMIESINIYNAETDVLNKEPGAEEALQKLLDARTERLAPSEDESEEEPGEEETSEAKPTTKEKKASPKKAAASKPASAKKAAANKK